MKRPIDCKYVIIDIKDHIAYVTINRPPVNALNHTLVEELTLTAKSLRSINNVWYIVLTAVGNVFCAGADIKERNGLQEKDVLSTVKKIQNMVFSWITVPQPVLVGINGPALGGGLELALAGDIIAASEKAVLGFPEVKLGIIPGAGGTQILTHLTSQGIAKKWILSAKRFSAREALNDRVISFVFPAKSFNREFSKLIDDICSNAPLAVRQAKKSIRMPFLSSLKTGLKYESSCYINIIPTQDRREAIRAFIEKRSPKWLGT